MRTPQRKQQAPRYLCGLVIAAALLFLLLGCENTFEPVPELQDQVVERPAARADLLGLGPPTRATAAQAAIMDRMQWDQPTASMDPLDGFAARVNAAAGASATTCTIAFDNYESLDILPDKAGYTFASSPYYMELCGNGIVHVTENQYGHYHLDYQTVTFCLATNGLPGFRIFLPAPGGQPGQLVPHCIPIPDPAAMPRVLRSHLLDQWIRINAHAIFVERTFDLNKIKVEPGHPIQLWARKANGNWVFWSHVNPGTWNLSQHASGIREIRSKPPGAPPAWA
jgi:hypothetical protein